MMMIKTLRLFIVFVAMSFGHISYAQLQTYKISEKGDTLNAVDKKGMKQGKWVVHVDELRGEPGYEEEGLYANDKREGFWRRYSLHGDLLAVENYRYGGKDGLSQYFTPFGELLREEGWKAYNPDAPYDTIPVYGTGSNEILSYKVVKAEQYSVKDGSWKYYDPSRGVIIKSENYDRGHLLDQPKAEVANDGPKKQIKPAEVLEYEKKNSGRKKVKVRDGQTE